jgi:hypothetical protein
MTDLHVSVDFLLTYLKANFFTIQDLFNLLIFLSK